MASTGTSSTGMLGEACGDLTTWLTALDETESHPDPASAGLPPPGSWLLAEADEDGTSGIVNGRTCSSPPWNPAVACASFNTRYGVRRIEAHFRGLITGRKIPLRPGSDGNTRIAIQMIPKLAEAEAVDDEAVEQAIRDIEDLAGGIKRLRAIDEAPVWHKLKSADPASPALCPWCQTPNLWYAQASGMVSCFLPSCADEQGRRPAGRLDLSRISNEPVLVWQDGSVR